MKTIEDVLSFLARLFPRFELKRETIEAYDAILSDIPVDELYAAAVSYASTHTFFPAAGELRMTWCDLHSRASGIPTAYEAWHETMTAEPGHTWSHQLVKDTAYLMGWNRGLFPTGMINDIPTDRAHFLKAYDSAIYKATQAITTHPAVQRYIEAQRPQAQYLPQPERLTQAPRLEPEYKSMREALGTETVAQVSARLKAKASEGKP